MRLAKLAVASISPTVGAVRSNVDRLIAVAHDMAAANVTLAAFPEQAIGGYPPEDLVQWAGFLRGQRTELARFARETANSPTVTRRSVRRPRTASRACCRDRLSQTSRSPTDHSWTTISSGA